MDIFTVRTGSRDIWLATVTITIIIFLFVAVVIIVLLFVLFLYGCFDDEIKMYDNTITQINWSHDEWSDTTVVTRIDSHSTLCLKKHPRRF